MTCYSALCQKMVQLIQSSFCGRHQIKYTLNVGNSMGITKNVDDLNEELHDDVETVT